MKNALAVAMLVSGFWWWRSDPDVEKGNAKAQDGRFEEALADFERAESSLSTEEQKRQLAFDRGIALHGAGKLDEAQKAFAHAAQSEDPSLRSRAAFNEGNTALAKKDKKGAIDAFVRSLRADPAYAPARKNLELLLSEPPPPPDGGPGDGDGGAGDGGSSDGGGGGGGDGGSNTDGGSKQDGGGTGKNDNKDDNSPPPMDKPQDEQEKPRQVDEQDAMKLLDAMRDAEKNKPLGRIMLKDGRPRKSSKEW